ncbi:MAG: bifunctional diaminohydroxyphosphoribosylaminopyrimidine deaminase/5-amino-6-(5-phosphoribosylamino)uracil reductase RibD [Gemmatimonadetes bacterium]|nr:bifunctional diaminohydroxyphosphoribosylaminopyrimidine deaminase/5-amino-6-(5-phosphoribosylamino)uracil reductase RibD [Gemmatimonadota bacterium]MDA1104717.1 bifunctional diaminohydroxyphosphoribosylaminopyrimidine deaminase/5-amino-6-(5-phosphoribosylamino)uracil reductase RibD [Gemmatimonadota bacterium]
MHELELAPDEKAYLDWARQLGRRGWGHVHPNPMVGCVLVRDGAVVGEGYHEVFGGPHAEILALERALSRANGATVFVSLEPCNHHGKTPPCATALIQAGVSRVVYGVADPGPESGGGAAALRAAGIDVVGPVWPEAVGRAENPAFFHSSQTNEPFLALKLAMSLDAKIAPAPGVRARITGVEAEREVHRLRTGFDAVMVGSGTVRADDPRLTPRMVAPGRTPIRRIVLSSQAALPTDAALFEDVGVAPVHVFARLDAPETALERLEAAGAHVHPVPSMGDRLDLDSVLAVCWEIGVRAILCEGGAELAANLLRRRKVHRLYLFIAPTTLGDGGVPAFPNDAAALDWDDFRLVGSPTAFGSDSMIVLDRQEA